MHAGGQEGDVLGERSAAGVRPYLLLVLGLLVLTGLSSLPAFGQPSPAPSPSPTAGGETALFGTIRSGGQALEGVEVAVATEGGEEVGTGTTDERGAWSVEVPGGGTYAVTLVPETLPEGLEVREPDQFAEQQVQVADGQRKAVLFPVVEAGGGAIGSQNVRRFLNLLVEGIKFGAIIAITSIGLSLIFGVTGLVNFAHGEMVTLGAVTAFYLNSGASVPWWLAIAGGAVIGIAFGWPAGPRIARARPGGTQAVVSVGAIVAIAAATAVVLAAGIRMHLIPALLIALLVGAVIGFGMQAGLFGPLRERGTGLIALLVISIGVSILIRFGILVYLTGQSFPYRNYTIQRPFELGPITTTAKDLTVTVISLAVLALVGLLLTRTKLGTAMRAVADNRDLAESSGIDVQRVVLAVWIGGGALAALGGVFQGMVQAVVWDMGFKLLLLMFAGIILGGLGTAFGAMVGGLLIGIVTQVSTFWFTVDLKLVFAFGVLIVVLLFRPQGVLGRKERIG